MNLRTRVLVVGGVIGALIGVAAAGLYLRSTPIDVNDEGEEKLPSVSPGRALSVGLGVLSVLKQIVGLGVANRG